MNKIIQKITTLMLICMIMFVLPQIVKAQYNRASNESWKAELKVACEGDTVTCAFGGDPSATDNFDIGLDIAAPPSSMAYYAYFEIAGFINALQTDLRAWIEPYDADITWTLKVMNSAGKNSTITWDPTQLPIQGIFTVTGANGPVDMRAQDSVRFNGDKSLQILYRAAPDLSWKVPISINCEDITLVRTFGGHPAATDSFDLGLDIAVPPSAMNFYAYFQIEKLPYSLGEDIRAWIEPYDTDISWNLKVLNTQAKNTVFTWDPAKLPTEGTFTIEWSNATLNMRTEDSLTIAGDSEIQIKYSATGRASWTVPLTITSENVTLTRTFGGHPDATDGFDIGLDIAIPPPAMSYYAYFQIPGFINMLEKDMRAWLPPYETEITWTLQLVYTQGKSTTITWDATLLHAEGNFTLEGTNLEVNMRTKSSVTVDGDKTLTIRYTVTETENWAVPLTIESEGITFTRTFGGDPNGTDDFDTGLDIAVPPPAMSFYTYFQISGFINMLEKDIRGWVAPFDTDITWLLQVVYSQGKRVSIKWDPANLPTEGNFTLEGANGAIDMRSQSSATFSGDKSILIKYISSALAKKHRSSANAASWELPINIVGGDNVNLTRTFGGDAAATDDYDVGLDVASPPPAMSYYAYFQIGGFINMLVKDLRGWVEPYDQEITWTLVIINSQNKTSTLSWDAVKLPPLGDFILSGLENPVDMRAENSITFTGDKTLTIQYQPKEVATAWLCDLTINGDNLTFVRTFGGDSTATDNYDDALDKVAPPAGMGYYNYFEITEFPNYLEKDVRSWHTPFETNHTWTLQIINAVNVNSTITWEPACLPAVGEFIITDLVDSMKMRLENSMAVVGNQTIKILYIGSEEPAALRGDVDGDGKRTIADLMLVIAFINGTQTPTSDQEWAADCNADGEVNILDVVQLIRWINSETVPKHIPTMTTATAQIIFETAHFISAKRAVIPVKLITNQPVAGIQVKLRSGKNGVIFKSPQFQSATNNLQYAIDIDQNHLNLLLYDTQGTPIEAGEQLLFELPLELNQNASALADLEIVEVMLANSVGQMIPVHIHNSNHADSQVLPKTYSLKPNFPNPFNPATKFSYQLPEPAQVTIKVYNMLGQEIKTLIKMHQPAGEYQIEWDGTNALNQAMGSGIYLCVMQAGDFKQIQKMALVR